MFRCLPSWARLYFSSQAERNRFGGICFWPSPSSPTGNRINRIKARHRRMTSSHIAIAAAAASHRELSGTSSARGHPSRDRGELRATEGLRPRFVTRPQAVTRSTSRCRPLERTPVRRPTPGIRSHPPQPLDDLGRRTSLWPPTGKDRPLFRSLHRGYQARVWVDGLPLPPQLFGTQLEDRKMQMRRARIRISRGSDKTDDVPTLDPHCLTQPFHVPVQVRVVVAIRSRLIELVYGIAARFTEEQLADGPGYHRTHGCPSRLQNVDRFMRMSAVNFFEHIAQTRQRESADGWSHLENGRFRANREERRQQPGNASAEPQSYSSMTIGVPRRTMCDSSATSQFVIRMHPADSLCRICPGSGVPWIP